MRKKSYMRESCKNCRRPIKACFCKELRPFHTNSRFCILMHPMEAKASQIGTGRLTALALKNSEIIIGIDFDANLRFNELVTDKNYYPLVLYPGANAINLDSINNNALAEFSNKKLLIFIIDATWPCAKKMMKKTTKLHLLPKICFEQRFKSNFSIKHQPAKFCLSTIESAYHLIAVLEACKLESSKLIKKNKETMLLALTKCVDFHLSCASDPGLNNYQRKGTAPRDPLERAQSKKWETRKIIFEL